MHVFIVRPFGTKNGIDFDRVERELIRPAMGQAGFTGGTTGEFLEQGNIRTNMFEELLIADLVVADISIHNANVFYELGIRHALRDKRTFLIKSKGDEVPFDLKTDRYLAYDATNPAKCVETLTQALKATWNSPKRDSPVFQLMPALEPVDHNRLLIVPMDFREDIERAASAKECGDLQLLSAELDGFAWKTAGLRIIGNEQFKLNDIKGAKVTWEAVRDYDDIDLDANKTLGTVYQKLGDRVRSDQALERTLKHKNVSISDLAEIRALLARNAKAEWERDWLGNSNPDSARKAALTSPQLKRAYELYYRGFIEDRNHFYSGLNALAMATIMTTLAEAYTDIWEADFDSTEEAQQELRKLQKARSDLAVGVRLAIESKRTALKREEKKDVWTEISAADLALLTSTSPNRIAQAYKTALDEVPAFYSESARKQLLVYQGLGILSDKVAVALNNIIAVESSPQEAPQVILFTGHRIDDSGREKPRFPGTKEEKARTMIAEAVSEQKAKARSGLLGVAGGASVAISCSMKFVTSWESLPRCFLEYRKTLMLLLPSPMQVRTGLSVSNACAIQSNLEYFQIRKICRAGSEQRRIITFGSDQTCGCYTMRFLSRRRTLRRLRFGTVRRETPQVGLKTWSKVVLKTAALYSSIWIHTDC